MDLKTFKRKYRKDGYPLTHHQGYWKAYKRTHRKHLATYHKNYYQEHRQHIRNQQKEHYRKKAIH
jgi:hypothetical protein